MLHTLPRRATPPNLGPQLSGGGGGGALPVGAAPASLGGTGIGMPGGRGGGGPGGGGMPGKPGGGTPCGQHTRAREAQAWVSPGVGESARRARTHARTHDSMGLGTRAT